MIIIKLREAMQAYFRRTGERITYARIAELTDLSPGTVEVIGAKPGYQASLATIEKLCRALHTPLHEMIEMVDDTPNSASQSKRSFPKARKNTA